MNTMADGARDRLVAQIGEALFGQPGLTLMELAEKVKGMRAHAATTALGFPVVIDPTVTPGTFEIRPPSPAGQGDATFTFSDRAKADALEAGQYGFTEADGKDLGYTACIEACVDAICRVLELPEHLPALAARQPVGEPVAWMTHHDEPMLFPTAAEAAAYCEDDEQPVPLFRSPAQGVDLGPLSMDTAPRDGTMVRLLVQFEENATEDTAEPAWTIGACNDDNVGEDERVGWQFAGWCWTHDYFTEGKGTPVGWLPMIGSAQAVHQGEMPEGWRLSKKSTCYQLSHGNDIVGNLVGPDAEENAAIIARVLDSKAVGNG